MNTKPPCVLCNLPVEIKGFKLKTTEGEKDFCCQGCLSIYQLFNEEKLLTPTRENKK